ncbi:MAG: hypothetical protein ACHQC8_02600 [Solirubrobacterales bacterium]
MSVDSGGAIMVDLIVTGGEAEALRRLCAASGRSPEAELLNLLRHSRPPAPSPNGSTPYTLTCSGCGLPFQSQRRQLPGRRVWCQDCRDAGEPAAQRARDYRARKHEGEMP